MKQTAMRWWGAAARHYEAEDLTWENEGGNNVTGVKKSKEDATRTYSTALLPRCLYFISGLTVADSSISTEKVCCCKFFSVRTTIFAAWELRNKVFLSPPLGTSLLLNNSRHEPWRHCRTGSFQYYSSLYRVVQQRFFFIIISLFYHHFCIVSWFLYFLNHNVYFLAFT